MGRHTAASARQGNRAETRHGHSHCHSDAQPAGGMTGPRQALLIFLGFCAVLAAIGLVALWPHGAVSDHASPEFAQRSSLNQPRVSGTVTAEETGPAVCNGGGTGQIGGAGASSEIRENTTPQDEAAHECRRATVEITSGDRKGETVALTHYGVPGEPVLQTNQKIVLTGNAEQGYAFVDYQRSTALIIWAVVIAAAVIAFAAWHGVRAILSLTVSLGIVFGFLLPGLAAGHDPVAMALTACAAIIMLSVPIVHGVNWKSAAALGGSLIALAVAALLAWLAIRTTDLQGLSSEDNLQLALYMPGVSIVGVLLSGFIVGALGGLNDVTIGQASTVTELAQADAHARPLQLLSAAMKVGRDHISSVVYTLVLTYAGTALPLLLLLQASQQPAGTLLSGDLIATELLRSGVGVLALALAVPLTTLIAAWTIPAPPAGNTMNTTRNAANREHVSQPRRKSH